jgi:hypothetical protein
MRRERVFTSSFASAAALIAVAVFAASPALAATTVVIANGAAHTTLVAGDIDGTAPITVAYQKKAYSYLRWSTDGGQTFGTPRALRGGLKAKNPRVAVCANNLWAVSEWPTTSGTKIGLDLVDRTANNLTGRWSVSTGGYGPDVACLSDAEPTLPLEKTVGVVWLTNAGNAALEINDWPCAERCSLPYFADLGKASTDEGIKIAAVDDGFVVTWVGYLLADGLNVQHFHVERSGGNINVTPGPVVHLLAGNAVFAPVIDGDGSRVVLAYTRNENVHLRISDNRGATFGARIVVTSFCTNSDCGSRATSIDARNGQILVEARIGGGAPPSFETFGRLTSNDGANWRTVTDSSRNHLGELLAGAVAEVRDNHLYRDPIYGDQAQQITFVKTPLN